jgi:hypothetical protein
VFVDNFDLATLAALRYARSLRPTSIRAVHFVIDSLQAERLREKWTRADRGVALDFIDCPDRRLTKAASDLVEREVQDPGTFVTVILPRRSYSQLLGRLLHDRTADKIAAVVSRIPRSAATIVPYDVPSRVAVLQGRQATVKAAKAAEAAEAATSVKAPRPAESVKSPDGQAAIAAELARQADVVSQHVLPDGKPRRHQGQRGPSKGATPIGSVTTPRKVTVEGKVRVIEIRPVEHNSVLAVEIHDPTGNLTAMFYGRSNIPGLICGSRVRLQGSAGIRDGQPVMINPAYELVSAVEEE